MKRYLRATRKSAALSGMVVGFGMPALDAFQSAAQVPASVAQLQFAVALGVFFFLPVVFFVAGTEILTFGFKDVFRKHYWLAMKELAIRGFCWLMGGGFAFAVLAAVHNLRGNV
jgi:hypothetical protein